LPSADTSVTTILVTRILDKEGLNVKKRDLERALTEMGWYFDRHGGDHDIWTNGLGQSQPIPRHNEIVESTAKKILKRVKAAPGERK